MFTRFLQDLLNVGESNLSLSAIPRLLYGGNVSHFSDNSELQTLNHNTRTASYWLVHHPSN